jgi:hypothetical protein
VRSVIVYTCELHAHDVDLTLVTGDHQNSSAFWAALKVQPIIQSGVQTWKALILVLSLSLSIGFITTDCSGA